MKPEVQHFFADYFLPILFALGFVVWYVYASIKERNYRLSIARRHADIVRAHIIDRCCVRCEHCNYPKEYPVKIFLRKKGKFLIYSYSCKCSEKDPFHQCKFGGQIYSYLSQEIFDLNKRSGKGAGPDMDPNLLRYAVDYDDLISGSNKIYTLWDNMRD